MANNPFYPGYSPNKPNESSSNPAYPGYYPGKKITRIPKNRSRPIGRIGDLGGTSENFSKFIDSFSNSVEGTLRGPDRWIAKRLADDFGSSLNIRALPPQGVSQEQLDDFETGSIPGGGFISLDIDPRKWLGLDEDPKKWVKEDGSINRKDDAAKKMLKKTLTGWAKSALEFKDLETTARTEFWNEILGKGYDPTKHKFLENVAYELTTGFKPQLPTQPAPGQPSIRPNNPFSLSGLGVYEVDTPSTFGEVVFTPGEKGFTQNKDVYDTVRDKAKDFARNAPSPLLRDLKYDVFLGNAVSAASIEMGKKNLANVASGVTANEAVNSFFSRTKLAESLQDLGKKRKDAMDELRKGLLNGYSDAMQKTIKDNLEKLHETVHKSETNFTAVKNELKELYGERYIFEKEDQINRLKKILDSSDFITLMSSTSSAGLSDKAREVLKDITLSSGIENILKGKDIVGGDVFMDSWHRQLIKDLGGELCANRNLTNFIEDNNLKGANILRTLIPRMQVERDLFAADEFLSKAQKNFTEAYLWSPRLGKLSDVTVSPISPKHFVQKTLSKVNNFGLILDDNTMRARGRKWDNNVAPGRLFGNRFSVKINIGGKAEMVGEYGDKWGVTGGRNIKVNVWGGDHFKVTKDLQKWSIMSRTGSSKLPTLIKDEHMKVLLVGGGKFLKTTIDVEKPGDLVFLRSLTGQVQVKNVVTGKVNTLVSREFLDLDLFAGCSTTEEFLQRIKDLSKQQKNIEEFRQWVHLNIINKNNLSGAENDLVFWQSLIDNVSKNEDAGVRYLGSLQKLGRGINKFQTQLYKIKPIGWVVRQVNAVKMSYTALLNKLKKSISKKITEFLAKYGSKAAIGTFLQGIGTAVAPIIGNAIAWIVTELIDRLVRALFRAIKSLYKNYVRLMKGELQEILDEVDKNLDKRAKKLMIILLIIILFSSFFSPLIGLLIPGGMVPGGILTEDPFGDGVSFALSTFSPTDPTRKHGSLEQSYDWNIVLGLDPTTGLPLGPVGPPGGGDVPPGPPGSVCDITAGKTLPSSQSSYNLTSAGRAITSRALEIAQGLERGFWGLFNHSPEYETNPPGDLWDEGKFATDPNFAYDPNDSTITETLFWCTYMAVYSARAAFHFEKLPGTSSMYSYINGSYLGGHPNYEFSSRDNTSLKNLRPGSIIFFSGEGGGIRHVGIVYSVSADGITTIESNSCDTSYFIPSENCGASSPYDCTLSNNGHMSIFGFGLLK